MPLPPADRVNKSEIVMLQQPPSIDANEITDKGSINQSAVLASRASLVGDLYAEHPSPRVLTNK